MNDREILNKVLEQGEIIRWSGVSQPYSLFDESFKQSTIQSLCWALAWGIFLLGGYYALSISKDIEIKSGVMLCFAVVPLFIIWRPISDRKKIKKLLYAVTDKRAIVASKDSDKPITMRITDIDDIRIDKADNDNCHIRVGSPVFKASSKKLPALALRGEFSGQDNNKIYKGLVFFNMGAEDEKAVRKLLKPATPSANE